MGFFELYKDSEEKFRFRIMDDSGIPIVVSEAHDDKDSAVATIHAAREFAATSLITDKSRPDPENAQ